MGHRRAIAILLAGGATALAAVAFAPRARSQAPLDAGVAPGATGGATGEATSGANDVASGDAGVEIVFEEDEASARLTLPVAPADPAARPAWLAAQLDAAVRAQPLLAGARVGAVVVDVRGGQPLWSHQAGLPLNLASVTKIITAAAALHTLGGDFRWRTSVLAEARRPGSGVVEGDLFLRGRGDPTLTGAGLRELAQAVAWRGVTEVTGDLVVDGSYFDLVDEPPRFADQPRERAGFRAPIGAASLERNAVTVVVVAAPGGAGPAQVSIEPPATDYVRLVTPAVATVATGRTRVHVASKVTRTHLELRVSGQILASDGVTFVRRRIDDPARMFGEVFRAALAERGVKVRGRRIGRGLAPPTAVLVAERASPPLAEVARAMVKTSDNFLAETILKTVGAESRTLPPPPAVAPPATWADGTAAVHRYLVEQAGVPAGSFRMENGSGLFDATAVSADAVARVLVAAWRDFRVGPDLAAAMATGGVDGTLRRRFTEPALRARIRAKTGTLAQVTALAGYAGVDSGRPLAFVVVVNGLTPPARAQARALQDTIAMLCVAYTMP